MIKIDGKFRAHDPVEMNDFWWHQAQKGVHNK
jgi:hypothetical protein